MYIYEINDTFYADFCDAQKEAVKSLYDWYDADPVYFGGEESKDRMLRADLEEIASWNFDNGRNGAIFAILGEPGRMVWQKYDITIRRYPVIESSH